VSEKNHYTQNANQKRYLKLTDLSYWYATENFEKSQMGDFFMERIMAHYSCCGYGIIFVDM